MKKCKNCEKEVSNSAKVCPNCGQKLKKPIVLYAILGIIALAIIGSVLSGNNGTVRKTEFQQNEVATFKDVNYSITKVERTQGKKLFEAKEGKEYIIISLNIENKSNNKISYNPLDWKMVDGTGDEKTYALFSGDSDTQLNSGELNAGGTKTGTVAFEIPKDDKNLTLKYYETIIDKERSFEFKITD